MEICNYGEPKQTTVYTVPHILALRALRMHLDTKLKNCGYVPQASQDGATFYGMQNGMPILIYEGTITGHEADDEDEDEKTTYPALRVVLSSDLPDPDYYDIDSMVKETLLDYLENPNVLPEPTEEDGGISYTVIASPDKPEQKYVSAGLIKLALLHKLRHIIE